MADIYSPPDSTLHEQTTYTGYGSLERGISGNYPLVIGDVIKEAWEKTNGAKWPFQLAFTLYIVVYFVVSLVLELVNSPAVADVGPDFDFKMLVSAFTGSFVNSTVSSLVTAPMAAGLFLLGVKRAVGAPLVATSIFEYYNKFLPLLIVQLLFTVLVWAGFIFFIIPGIYLGVAWYFAAPLVVDKNLSPWAAMETSRKAISKRWFAVFGLGIVLALINLATVVTLFIGLIWTLPMSVIAYGIVYRNMFGYGAENP